MDHGKLWMTLGEMGIPEHLTCLLRNLDVGQEAIVTILTGTTDWFKIEKGIWQGCLLSPSLFNLYAETLREQCQTGWVPSWNQDRREKHQQPQICRWYHSNGRKRRGTKEPLDEGEGGKWKSRLKSKYLKSEDHGIQPHYWMADRRGKGGSSDRFPLLGLQNHRGQWLQPWNQKTIASWQESNGKPSPCVEKQGYYSASKGLYSQGYDLLSGHVHKEGRPSLWTMKKAELKNWCLPTAVLEKTPEVPWTARRSNQSVLRKINPEYSLEGLILKKKLQYFGHLMQTDDSWKSPRCWERLRIEGEEGIRRRDGWTTSLTQWTWPCGSSRRWWGINREAGCDASMGSQRVGHDWATRQQNQHRHRMLSGDTVQPIIQGDFTGPRS